jgi:hypothetical protein
VKRLRHPATIIASLALFVALTGGAAAYASGLISGSQIKNHSIPTKKLTRSAITSLRGKRGVRGPAGPQGPGGRIVTYDATASASPKTTTLGVFLDDTIGASCRLVAGAVVLTVYVQTHDGSWNVDFTLLANNNGTVSSNARKLEYKAGKLSTLTGIDSRTANPDGHESDGRLDFLQLSPSPGSMIWHETVSTKNSAHSCHLSVQSFPETITAVAGS